MVPENLLRRVPEILLLPEGRSARGVPAEDVEAFDCLVEEYRVSFSRTRLGVSGRQRSRAGPSRADRRGG
jgi:hypothetical protein